MLQLDYESEIEHHIRRFETILPLDDGSKNADEETIVGNLPDGGLKFGHYANAHHHKDGLFSEIYKAQAQRDVHHGDTSSNNSMLLALKVTHPGSMIPPHDSKRECRLLTRAKHCRVIELIESFTQSGGQLILVFPFIAHDLEGVLRAGPLSEENGKTCLRDMMSGLDYLHRIGIIHRDIKPSNILLKSLSGPAVIADFGIAWTAEDPSAEPANLKILDVGTTSYRPPELLFGKQWYDTSLDLWAAGCVASQMVCLGSRTLFDSGDLGSELALIKSIFETMGTPDLNAWPEASSFPDWGKMTFVHYEAQSWSEIMPRASKEARNLVSSMVRYESKERLTAAMVRVKSETGSARVNLTNVGTPASLSGAERVKIDLTRCLKQLQPVTQRRSDSSYHR